MKINQTHKNKSSKNGEKSKENLKGEQELLLQTASRMAPSRIQERDWYCSYQDFIAYCVPRLGWTDFPNKRLQNYLSAIPCLIYQNS